MSEHLVSKGRRRRRLEYQSPESGKCKKMHRSKILTYMSFVCLIEDEQVSEQRGVETGTERGAKDGLTRKRRHKVEGDTKQFLGIQ
jgi:hypothetical protein